MDTTADRATLDPAVTADGEPGPATAPQLRLPLGAPTEAPVVSRRLLFSGLAMVLLGAWGGVVAYVGPDFGFGPPGSRAWQWTTAHTWLNLAPGAAAMLAGLMILAAAPRLRRASMVSLGVMLAAAAGAWFILGPSVYPMFYGGAPLSVSTSGAGALGHFAVRVGYGLGVGAALCLLAGLAAGARAPMVRVLPEWTGRSWSGRRRRHWSTGRAMSS